MIINKSRILTFILTSVILLAFNSKLLISQNSYKEDASWIIRELEDGYANIGTKEQRFHFDWDTLCKEFLTTVESTGSDREFFLETNRFLAKLHDGHLGFRYANGNIRNRILTYPDQVISLLGLRLTGGKVIVVSAPEKINALGSELLSIEKIPIDTILDRMTKVYCLRGTPEANRSQILVYNKYWDYFDLFEDGFPTSIHLTIRDDDSVRTEIIERGDFTAQQEKIAGSRLGLPDENPSYHYSFIESKIALLTIPTFEVNVEDFSSFLGSFADSCRSREISGLIIDLRYNGGGNESFRDLLSYLVTDTLDILYYRYRLSASFKDNFTGRLEWERENRKTVRKAEGEEYSEWFSWQIFPAEDLYFTDLPVVVLANENIFSSTGNFLYAVQKHGLAQIMGPDIPLSGHGLGRPILLPNKNFTFRNCYFESVGIEFEPLENEVITPDIPVIKPDTGSLEGFDEDLLRVVMGHLHYHRNEK